MSVSEKIINIKSIVRALEPELELFRKEFVSQLKSGIFLIDQINRFVVRGQGKTLRPMVTFLAAKLVGESTERTIKGTLIVEYLHNATLIHDDIVDDSDKRRGLPSVKKIKGSKVAVLYGDYLLAHSLTAMLDLRDLAVFDILSVCARRLAKGELLQAAKARKLDIDEGVYFQMIADKTAALMSASSELGGLTGGGDLDQRRALKDYGEMLGMAFQIRDDLLDFEGRAGILGKPVGGDIKEKKITLPLIYALRESKDGHHKGILKAIKTGKGLKDVVSFVKDSGGLEYADEKAKYYSESAKMHLDIFPDSEEKEMLLCLADYAVLRDK